MEYTYKTTVLNCDTQDYSEWLVGTSVNGNDLLDWGEGVWEVLNKDETYTDGFGSVYDTVGYDVQCRQVA